MSRFKSYGQADEQPLIDRDVYFAGVEQYRQPHQLEPGYVAEARNARFVAGRAEPRLGVAKLPWTNGPASGQTPQPLGTIYGAGVYRDSEDVEWCLIAADGVVYRTREGAGLVQVPIPPGEYIDYEISFTQTYNGIVMFRGPDLDELIMDDLDVGFRPVSEETNPEELSGEGTENPNDGEESIPPAYSGEWIGNRLFVPYETTTQKDLVAVSDYLNATLYAPVRGAARINQGSSDRLVRVVKFNEFSAVAFKEKSTYALYNVTGDLSEMALDEVSGEVGLAARYGVVQTGREADETPSQLWFLSAKRGIMSLLFGEYGKLQLRSVPVSRPIQKLIDRIDWRYASKARAAWWNNRVYFAVPLDSSKLYTPTTLPQASYAGGVAYHYVVPGTTYRWTPGENDTKVANGSEELTDQAEFTAATYYVTLYGSGSITCTVDRVYTETNNAVLVYDFLNGAWSGYDDGPAYGVREFVKLTYNGENRLFFVSTDGYINLVESLAADDVMVENGNTWDPCEMSINTYDGTGRFEYTVTRGSSYIYELNSSTSIENGTGSLTDTAGSFVAQRDVVTLMGTPSATVTTLIFKLVHDLDTRWPEFELLTRGYTAGEFAWKEFQAGSLHLATWYPNYSVASVLDGANEELSVLDNVTKSRVDYYKPFTQEDWDETNANDDHATPWRQDYSILLDQSAVTSGIAAGDVYYVENLAGTGGVVYNSAYYAPETTFTGVSGVTTFSQFDTNLIASWKMEEATGDRIDSKGSNDLSPRNSPSRATGKLGYALSMSAANQQLQIDSNADLVMGDIGFTIAGWWYFTTVAGAPRLMCGKGYAGDASNEYHISADTTPQSIRFRVGAGATIGEADSGVVPNTGVWYFVCAWHDATNNKIGIQINNGTPVEVAHTAGVPTGTRVFTVGNGDVAQPFLGRVDALHIWKRVLTAAERAALYNSGAGLEIVGAPSVYPPGGYVFLGDNGINFNLEQESAQDLELDGRMRGRFLQLRVTNSQGRSALLATEVEAVRSQRRLSTKA